VARKKRGHFVLWLVTLKVLIRSAPNLAQINVILFLTLHHNLFESTLGNNFRKHRTCGGTHLQSWKRSTHPQESVRNWKKEGHFTVVCSAKHDLAAKKLWRLSWFIFQNCFEWTTN